MTSDDIRICDFECEIDGYDLGQSGNLAGCCLEYGHKGAHQVKVSEEGF